MNPQVRRGSRHRVVCPQASGTTPGGALALLVHVHISHFIRGKLIFLSGPGNLLSMGTPGSINQGAACLFGDGPLIEMP